MGEQILSGQDSLGLSDAIREPLTMPRKDYSLSGVVGNLREYTKMKREGKPLPPELSCWGSLERLMLSESILLRSFFFIEGDDPSVPFDDVANSLVDAQDKIEDSHLAPCQRSVIRQLVIDRHYAEMARSSEISRRLIPYQQMPNAEHELEGLLKRPNLPNADANKLYSRAVEVFCLYETMFYLGFSAIPEYHALLTDPERFHRNIANLEGAAEKFMGLNNRNNAWILASIQKLKEMAAYFNPDLVASYQDEKLTRAVQGAFDLTMHHFYLSGTQDKFHFGDPPVLLAQTLNGKGGYEFYLKPHLQGEVDMRFSHDPILDLDKRKREVLMAMWYLKEHGWEPEDYIPQHEPDDSSLRARISRLSQGSAIRLKGFKDGMPKRWGEFKKDASQRWEELKEGMPFLIGEFKKGLTFLKKK